MGNSTSTPTHFKVITLNTLKCFAQNCVILREKHLNLDLNVMMDDPELSNESDPKSTITTIKSRHVP